MDPGEPPSKQSPSIAARIFSLSSSSQDLEARGGNDSTVMHKSSSTVLHLKDLPPNVAAALASLDMDGDGTIDVGELHHGAKETERTISKSKFYRKMLIILLGVCLAQLASFCGVMVGTINLTKESHVNNAISSLPVMTKKAGDQVLSVASLATPMTVSSVMPDTAWAQLKQFAVTNAITCRHQASGKLRRQEWRQARRNAAFNPTPKPSPEPKTTNGFPP